MSLVIEDGTGRDDAESYVSVTDCATYADNHGLSFEDNNTAEAALRRATTWLDSAYAWPGERTHGRDQALQWPRKDARDAGGVLLDDDEIPTEVVDACCVAAVREQSDPGSLSPDVTMAEAMQSVKVGPISVTYKSGTDLEDQKPILTIIDSILAALIGSRYREMQQQIFSGSARA